MIQQSLFPDNPYGVDSGGDPAEIPDLTYEQFKRFHETLLPPVQRAAFSSMATTIQQERLRIIDTPSWTISSRSDVDSAIAAAGPISTSRAA